MSEAQSEVAREIGRRVRERREKKGWTQFELAVKTEGGITPVTISRVENGAFFPRPETLDQIAQALGVRLNELLGMRLRRGKQGLTQLFGDFLRSATWTPASVV